MASDDEIEPARPAGRSEARRIGGFRILRPIGRGGMGTVFEAEQESLRRRVALKVLDRAGLDSERALERFRREARAAAKLSHPGIVPVHAFGEEGGVPHIAMELVQGRTLDHVISGLRALGRRDLTEGDVAAVLKASGGGPDPGAARGRNYLYTACRMIAEVAEAVQHAHDHGIIHRDLKPGNVIVRGDGTPLVMDFGLAQSEGDFSLTETGEFMGTVAYMSPEQVAAKRMGIDHRTDVYSLGVTLYEFLTLRRPFEGNTREQLISQILTKDPVPPRKVNPGLPRDVETIIVKAADRDRDKRYQTAGELAADLRRFLNLEPIVARPAGPVSRARKWARRHPGEAVAALAGAVLLLGALGAWAGLQVRTASELSRHLGEGEVALQEARPEAAVAAAERALGVEPGSAAALDLRRRGAAAQAAKAREEAATKERDYVAARAELDGKRKRERELRDRCFNAYAPTPERAELNRLENEIAQDETRLERLAGEGREALERAHRHEAPHLGGEPSPKTRSAFAEYFLARWREALEAQDLARERLYREEVEKHDREKRHAATLLGRGTLMVTVDPSDAEIFLFRYERLETVRREPPVVSRLVPVPTNGIGRCREGAWAEGFHPGDPCLLVTAVEKDSIAARARLRPGDLVIRLNGQPCGEGLTAGQNVNGPPSGECRTLQCLQRGEVLTVDVPKGGKAGLACEVTAYPLILSRSNRIEAGKALEVDPGSYLLLVRAPGHEDQRYPVLVKRSRSVTAPVKLLAQGTSPDGFVYIPPGRFIYGGDPEALQVGQTQEPELKEFWIARLEVTTREWSDFVNDPETLRVIERAREEGRTVYLPLDASRPQGYWQRGADGKYVPDLADSCPVLGISWNQIQDYLEWRNGKAEGRWVVDLPTEEEWEKAARGVDGRCFPWGGRFDPSLTVGRQRTSGQPQSVPGRFEPRDESPFGVADLAGSRFEWTRNEWRPGSRSYPVRGGSWSNTNVRNFRAASRRENDPSSAYASVGFRLVARPRP